MADRVRKAKDRVGLNCQIDAETKLYLIHFAGEFGLGWAIDRIVEIQRRLATDPQPTRNIELIPPVSFSNSVIISFIPVVGGLPPCSQSKTAAHPDA